MARPLRIEGSDFWYHVMARGIDGRELFVENREYEHFLHLVSKYAELFEIDVHAYVLMPNHFHLLACTHKGDLGRFMQRLLTAYSVWYNKRRQRYGHVFQGRYKAIVVEREGYATEVSRYIHLNPARVGNIKHTLNALRRTARQYKWSSYAAYLGLARSATFLRTNILLQSFGKTTSEQRRAYAQFVEEGLMRDVSEFREDIHAQSILGSPSFVDRISDLLCAKPIHDSSAKGAQRLLESRSLEKVIAAVAEVTSVDPAALKQRYSRHTVARKAALWALARWCSARFSLQSIGQTMGGISASAVLYAVRTMEEQCRNNRELQTLTVTIAKKLSSRES